MNSESDLAWIASVVGDPARLRILLASMDGRARTAKELSYLAKIAPPTASAHLAKLVEGRLLSVEPQGPHRFFKLASPLAGQLVEALAVVAADAPMSRRWRLRITPELATARTCYDHLAGRLGVAITDSLRRHGYVVLADGGGEVTSSGRRFLADLGLDLDRHAGTRRIYCWPCLDWSERRHHLAGAVGAALCEHCVSAGWVRQTRDSRALTITSAGRAAFRDHFAIADDDLLPGPDSIAA